MDDDTNPWAPITPGEQDVLIAVVLQLMRIPSLMERMGWSSVSGMSHYWHTGPPSNDFHALVAAIADDVLVVLADGRGLADHLPSRDEAAARLTALLTAWGQDATSLTNEFFADG